MIKIVGAGSSSDYNHANNVMENQRENLINRRNFFRKSANRILPLLSGIFLGSIPANIIKATTQYCPSCENDCKDTCFQVCRMTCFSSCQDRCRGGCADACAITCRYGCKGTCDLSCNWSCLTLEYY